MSEAIAFLGIKGSVSYYRVGGTESIVRRIAHQYNSANGLVYIITYDEDQEEKIEVNKNLYHLKFPDIESVFSFFNQNKLAKIFTVNVGWKDKIKLNKFLFKNGNLEVNTILTNYRYETYKQVLSVIESAITYRSGTIFCISDRIKNGFKFLPGNVKLIWPPIENHFFNENPTPNNLDKKTIGYMGRLDFGKGADIAISFFKNNSLDKSNFKFIVFSYPWKRDDFSMSLHNDLKAQDEIVYKETIVESYNKALDQSLKDTIDAVDIFLLPYRYLNSTVDTPLVPLEIMARKKVFIAAETKGLKRIVPNDLMLLSQKDFQNPEILSQRIKDVLENYETIQKDISNFLSSTRLKSSQVLEDLFSK